MIFSKRTEANPSDLPITPTTLYVVFHGEILLIDDENPNHPILVMAPVIKGHTYQAGPWLGEIKMEKRSILRLKGVTRGDKTIFENPERTLLLNNVPFNPDADWYFAILLPRPAEILPGLILNLKPGLLKDIEPPEVEIITPPGKSYPTGIDVHPVFRYNVYAGMPGLYHGEDLLFKAGGGRPNYLSLHISAEEDREVKDPAHAQEAFDGIKTFWA